MRSTTRTRPLIAAAAVLLIAVTSACTGGSDSTPTPTLDPAPSGAASDSGGAPVPSPSEDEGEPIAGECKAAEGDEKLPTEAPPVDTWEDVAGLGVPTSNTYGPHTRDGEVWTCYEHSPVGAVFAAFYVYAALGNVEGVPEAWIADSDVKAQMVESGSGGTSGSGTTGTVAGFRVVSFTPERAVVDAVVEINTENGPGLASMRFPFVWQEGDWKLDGEAYLNSRPTPLETLDGYTEWAPHG